MMKHVSMTLTLVALVTLGAMAQRDQTLFRTIDLSGAWGGSQIALTQFDGRLQALHGGFGGVEFNKNLFIGGASYNTREYDAIDNSSNYNMRYGGPIIGIGSQSHRVVHPHAMLLVAPGWGEAPNAARENLLVIQPSAGVELNVFRWFRVGVRGGYRIAASSGNVSDAFSGGYGAVSFKFGWSWGSH